MAACIRKPWVYYRFYLDEDTSELVRTLPVAPARIGTRIWDDTLPWGNRSPAFLAGGLVLGNDAVAVAWALVVRARGRTHLWPSAACAISNN